MFPVSIGVATIAMASGVEGATFFTPIFLLGLGLPVEVAIGTGLITEVFGFGSGLFAYVRRGLIDYRLGAALLLATMPAALLGAWIAGWVADDILQTILAVGLFVVALSFLSSPDEAEVERMDEAVERDYGGERAQTCLLTATGEEIRYTVCNRTEGRLIAGIGAMFMGMVSTGLGEMNAYFLLRRCRVPSSVSVATSVFVVAITALTAATTHVYRFVNAGGEALPTVLSLALFTVPGVVLGGQLGSLVAAKIPQRVLERAMAVLFILVAALMLAQVVI